MNDRARVPFALVGVVLLVGSTTFAATLATRSPAQSSPATERALERTTAATTTALRTATRRAARQAARRPVTRPANTTAGGVLAPSTPFRDYLRIRLYLAARQHLQAVDQRVEDVRTTVALPPVRSEADLRRAKDRVYVERWGPEGRSLRVRVENVTATARRDGRVVERVGLSPTFVVETPVLAMHDRVERFRDQLAAGPFAPGLTRRLTARLYGLAWARGYAQYGGLPISNVIANRHVELATNHALLATQRDVFGRADPAGRRGLRAATRRVAYTDVLTAAGASPQRTDAILRAAERIGPGKRSGGDKRVGPDPVGAWGRGAPSPEDELAVGVNRSADRAYVQLLETNLTAVLRSVYSADVRLVARRELIDRDPGERHDPPSGWTLGGTQTRTERRVTGTVRPRSGAADERGDWHRLRAYGRRVVRETTTIKRWHRDGRTRTTRSTRRDTFRVTVALLGRHAPSRFAPRRGIESVHRPGVGPLDGPNLAGIEPVAVEQLVTDRGGPDALALQAVQGELDTTRERVYGSRPDGLRNLVARELVGVRNRVRNVTVQVRRGSVGTLSVNPPAALAEELRGRRGELVDAPATYGHVAAKARAATRAAYVDRVVARLELRAARQRRTRGAVDDVLRDHGGSLAAVDRSLRARRTARTVDPAGEPGETDLGPTGAEQSSVDGAPPYLTLAEISRERAGVAGDGDVRPLAARNLNVFTVPYGEAADAVIGGLFGPQRVHLRTAARTLLAANRANASGNDTLGRRRNALRNEVRVSVGFVRRRVRRVLRRQRVGASERERREIVGAGLADWHTPAGRALALTNGSAVRRVAREAATRDDRFAAPPERTRLAMALRVTVDRALASPKGRPRQPAVNGTATVLKAVARRGLETAFEHLGEEVRSRWAGEALGTLPAGVPVTPSPGQWYATLNVWHVEVMGGYERFTVRGPRGRPGSGGAAVAYTRAGTAVRLDVDDDGRRELLGRNENVSFRTNTTVVVVVPPGGRGVGDTDGNADERSSGWPTET